MPPIGGLHSGPTSGPSSPNLKMKIILQKQHTLTHQQSEFQWIATFHWIVIEFNSSRLSIIVSSIDVSADSLTKMNQLPSS